jgi:alpha-L-fucosidase
MNRRSFLLTGAVSLATRPVRISFAAGARSVTASEEAVRVHRTPAWFRDAKFGITAQWTPQSVPEDGDWYARNMYTQGMPQYQHHLLRYGHPSRFGYKDLCRIWSGAEWDPAALMDRYCKAGAKYFVCMANHHDGFDCWNSKHQPWNSAHLGPKVDIVGGWKRAARGRGLRFGVEVFCTQNWQWFQVSHGSDSTGPLRGVPYDGHLTREDGRHQWWDGLDPQQLYGPPHPSYAPPSPAYQRNFELRVRDLITQHSPDLIFYTDNGLPLGAVGVGLAAYQFQENSARHGGQDEAVVCTKRVPTDQREAIVCDRYPDDAIGEAPWQMDICIGDWHYKQGLVYKTAADVIPYLVDVVSKNGNLLLNIPIRAAGSIDGQEAHLLEEVAAWFALCGEGIFETRPWRTFGEGPTRTQNVDFPYRTVQFTEQDIRFTIKGTNLYAFLLRWPPGRSVAIRSLGRDAAHAPRAIAAVELLGSGATVDWKQDADALTMALPERPPSPYPCALRVRLATTA